jgi:hypothetical protein
MMNYQINTEPFSHVIIEETFDEDQYDMIWRELDFLLNKFKDPAGYMAAKDDEGKYLTTAKGLSLDSVYHNDYRNISDILTICENMFFNNDKFYDDLIAKDDYWITYQRSSEDYTKIRRYFPGDGYEPHSDTWVHVLITTTLCHKEDAGGNLYFPRYDHEIETKNNKTVIFPGWIEHSVTDVLENDRYAITKFVHCASK